jgi:hypothetical protein
MKVEEFIKGYKKSQDLFLQDHIKKIYIPLATKVADCKIIIIQSCYELDEATGVRSYSPNMVLADYLFDISILKRYTDIEELDTKGLEIYDKLTELNLIEAIEANVDVNELRRYRAIYSSTLAETDAKETNVVFVLKSLSPFFIEGMKEAANVKLKEANREEGASQS